MFTHTLMKHCLLCAFPSPVKKISQACYSGGISTHEWNIAMQKTSIQLQFKQKIFIAVCVSLVFCNLKNYIGKQLNYERFNMLIWGIKTLIIAFVIPTLRGVNKWSFVECKLIILGLQINRWKCIHSFDSHFWVHQ